MNYNRVISLAILCLLTSAAYTKAQDFTFSQFYEVPMLRNPALTHLFKGNLCVSGALRQQWQAVTTPYKTGVTSIDMKFGASRGNQYTQGSEFTVSGFFGLDKAGDSRLGRNNFFGAVNYSIPLNSSRSSNLAVGFLGGLTRSSFDPSRLTFDDQFQNGQYVPGNVTQQTFNNTARNYWDISAGVSYLNELVYDQLLFYLGAAVYHLNKQDVSFTEDPLFLKTRYIANGGFRYSLNEANRIYFFGDYIVQGGHRQGLIGFNFRTFLDQAEDFDFPTALTLGGSYRWGDALIPTVKMDYRGLALALSYDANVSKLKTASQFRGGFELTFSYRVFLKYSDYSVRQVDCTSSRFY